MFLIITMRTDFSTNHKKIQTLAYLPEITTSGVLLWFGTSMSPTGHQMSRSRVILNVISSG